MRAHRAVRLEVIGDLGHATAVEAFVRSPVGEQWALRIRFELDEHGPEVTEWTMRRTSRRAATAGTMLLRRCGLSAEVDKAIAAVTDYVTATRFLGEAWVRPPKRPGRGTTDPTIYAEWARKYVDALEVDARAPYPVLVAREAEAGRPTDVGKVKAMVHKARRRELLTQTEPGVPGGKLTAKALRLLAQLDGTEGN